jgi:hypothetical protein
VSARGLGLLGLLVGLALLGGLWALDAQRSGPASAQAQQAITQAQAAAAGVDFSQASVALEAWRAANGTYVGATVPASDGARLVRADATSYCLETGVAPSISHEVGPGGSPTPGPC